MFDRLAIDVQNIINRVQKSHIQNVQYFTVLKLPANTEVSVPAWQHFDMSTPYSFRTAMDIGLHRFSFA